MTALVAQKNALRMAMAVTGINVLVASGYSIAGLLSPQSILPAGALPTEASNIFAMYAAARTLPLALVTLVAIYKRSAGALIILGLLAGLVQFADAVVGSYQHDLGKSIGPFVIAAFQLYVVYNLTRSAGIEKKI